MSRAQLVRDWMKTQTEPRTSAQIAAGVGGDKVKVQWAIGYMLRDGLIARIHMGKPATYVMVREALSEEQRMVVAREGRKKWLQRTDRVRGEARMEREAAKQAIANERNRQRLAATAAARLARAALAKVKPKTPRIVPAKPEKPVAVTKPAQSVDDWLKQGGQVQRLERGDGSGSRVFW